MKTGNYARVSTRDKGQNPDMQIEAMRKYCESVGWEIFREYVDKAEANDLLHRAAWTALLKDASLHKFDVVLIWKLDRAFRSNQHASNTLGMLNSYHVGFRSLNDPSIDTTTPNGMLVFNILASVAQFEKDLIVLRVNEGLEYARKHGTKSGKEIGRPALSIPLQTICKAVFTAQGNYTQAAQFLNNEFNTKVKAGFVSLRLKRANIPKDAILQTPGQYFDSAQTQF